MLIRLIKSRKTYYRYNSKTLEYERVYLSTKERFWAFMRSMSWALIIAVLAVIGSIYFFDSPMAVLLRKENKLLQTQYEMLLTELNRANEVLEDLQQRDENLYRVIFHADSIPESIRKSGFGGANRYEYLTGLPHSDLVIETTQKMDVLKKQLYVQSNSLDELISLGKDMENRLRCIPAIQPIANKDLKHTASGYGMRIDPIYHIPMFHSGMDFSVDIGTDIYATGDGTVVYAAWKQGYGNCVIISHGYNYETLYAHIDKYKVQVGKKVVRGEVIATAGNTGKSTGPHLHYEVLYKGRPDNPAKYYFQDLAPEEYDQMIQIAENQGKVMD